MVVDVEREPLVPLMVTVYVPGAVFLPVEIVSTDEPVPPDESVTALVLSVGVGLR
jgi:hypothetical protein